MDETRGDTPVAESEGPGEVPQTPPEIEATESASAETEVDPNVERRWTVRSMAACSGMALFCLIVLGALRVIHAHAMEAHAEAVLTSVRAEALRGAHLLERQVRQTEEVAKRLSELPAGPPDAAAIRTALNDLPGAIEVLVLPTDAAVGEGARYNSDDKERLYTVSGNALQTLRAEVYQPGWRESGLDPEHLTTTVAFVAHGAHQRVRVKIELEPVRDTILGLRSGEAGFGFLASASGRLLIHPVRELTRRGKSLADLADDARGHHILSGLHLEVLTGNEAMVPLSSDASGKDRSIWLRRVQGSGWVLGVVFAERDADEEIRRGLNRLWSTIALSLAVLFAWAAWVLWGYHGNVGRLWYGSGGAAIILLSAIGLVWRLIISGQISDPVAHVVRLTDQATVADYRNEHLDASRKARMPRPAFIPTGIFLQSLEFVTANNVYVRGYVWQKFTKGKHDDVTRGVLFPEGNEIKLKEAYRRETDEYELIGWQFAGVVREGFDFTGYPLDREVAWVRLWPADFHKNVVLVPDLGAYDLMKSSLVPGMEGEMVLSGWLLEGSFFDYHYHSYNSNFGIEDYVGQVEYPELYFNVVLKRDFVKAFVIDLVPILVITTLLFALLVTTTGSKEKADIYGQKATAVLSTSAGLLFGTILAHTKLRSEFAAQSGVIYLEFFYFALYLMLILIPINAFAVASGRLPVALKYRDGIIPKVLFWPVVLAIDLAVTLWFFH